MKYPSEKKEYKISLPKNGCDQSTVKVLNEEVRKLAEIEFINYVVPLFHSYLPIFQWERPLAHCLFEEMARLLYQLLRIFIKENERR